MKTFKERLQGAKARIERKLEVEYDAITNSREDIEEYIHHCERAVDLANQLLILGNAEQMVQLEQLQEESA